MVSIDPSSEPDLKLSNTITEKVLTPYCNSPPKPEQRLDQLSNFSKSVTACDEMTSLDPALNNMDPAMDMDIDVPDYIIISQC